MRMQTLQVMHMDVPAMVTRRDTYLRELRGLGLNPVEIGWRDGVGREAMQHLESIVAWVRRWRATNGDRDRMVQQGFTFPPVVPDISPEQDWHCFTRWMRHLPLHWSYEREHGPLPADTELTDEQIGALLDVAVERLKNRGVVLALAYGLPDRVCYRWLREELRTQAFEYLGAGTELTLDGCSGDCETCFQNAWCPLATALDTSAAG